jgi:ketosteroid isomerase-like protein
MSEENVARARHAYRHYNDTGELPDEFLHPDVVWHTPADIPERVILRGREAVRRHISGYARSFDDYRVEPREILDAGDQVVACVLLSGRIKGTESRVELAAAQVFRVSRDGRAIEVHEYRTKAEALEAAGLRE